MLAFVCRRTAPGGPTPSILLQEGTAGISSASRVFLKMENVRIFAFVLFIICGARGGGNE